MSTWFASDLRFDGLLGAEVLGCFALMPGAVMHPGKAPGAIQICYIKQKLSTQR